MEWSGINKSKERPLSHLSVTNTIYYKIPLKNFNAQVMNQFRPAPAPLINRQELTIGGKTSAVLVFYDQLLFRYTL